MDTQCKLLYEIYFKNQNSHNFTKIDASELVLPYNYQTNIPISQGNIQHKPTIKYKLFFKILMLLRPLLYFGIV